jgi:serine/threonine-protein kinase
MKPSDGADDPTLTPSEAQLATEPSPTAPTGLHHPAPPLDAPGYEFGELIGRGGMGEVWLARDRRIGREVAIKRLLSADPAEDELARFLREARIQARLDHPAIVPVHELGYDAEGRPYFTMKRLTGTTLHEMLGKPEVKAQRLLRAFAEVCLAIELAHSRGIVHRDLKPTNIMLGDYGEVYVLDWGVARVLAEAGADPSTPASIPSVRGTTQVGDILGTPGYMPPEQVLGQPVGPEADVYALGSILFEILTREPLHPRGHAALASTLEGELGAPSRRCPDRAIPPELDAACLAALVRDPAARPSARELGERVQRYLDGDRDLEQRRTLAAAELGRAHAALGAGDRATAMASAGRALALDPESNAAALVTKLMVEPPRDPPPALREALEAAEAITVAEHARTTVWSYSVTLIILPFMAWNGVLNWGLILSLTGLGLVLAIAARLMVYQPRRTLREMVIYILGNAVLLALVGRLCGPFILTPVLACMIIMSAVMYPVFGSRPRLLLASTLGGWLLGPICEQLGLVAPTWQVVEGAVISTSHAIHIGGFPTFVFVFGGSLVVIMVAVMHAGSLARANLQAQHQLVTQAWQLRQLIPVKRA